MQVGIRCGRAEKALARAPGAVLGLDGQPRADWGTRQCCSVSMAVIFMGLPPLGCWFLMVEPQP